ncbi:MAG: hypothetical protein WC365_06580 [Candidatus Babeliales bacterium]
MKLQSKNRQLKMKCRRGNTFVPPCPSCINGRCGEDALPCQIAGYVL